MAAPSIKWGGGRSAAAALRRWAERFDVRRFLTPATAASADETASSRHGEGPGRARRFAAGIENRHAGLAPGPGQAAISGAGLLGRLCLFAIAYFVAYKYGMSFSQAAAAPFWFPDSVLLCALLASPPRLWSIVVLVVLPVRLFSEVSAGIPLWFLLATFAIDSAKGLLTAALLRRFLRDPVRLDTVREYVLFCLLAVLLIPAASAFGGAAARQALGHDFWIAWEQWLLGDATAHLVITPAILYWVLGARRLVPLPSTKRWIEGALLAVALVVTSYMAFTGAGREDLGFADFRSFAPVPVLFWAAIRFGMFGASGAIVVIAVFSVEAALSGVGSFAGKSPSETAHALQNFLLLRAAPLYLVAILIQQMKDAELGLRESESLKGSILGSALDAIITMDHQGRIVEFNPAAEKMFGYDRSGVIDKPLADLIIPPSLREGHRQSLSHYVATGESRVLGARLEAQAMRSDGSEFPVELSVTRVDRGGLPLFTGFIRDLSERKRAEVEAQHHREELAHVTRVTTMAELTASVAHELRQPLAAILSNTEVAEMHLNADPPALDEVREILADIRSDDDRAVEIISAMRGFLQKQNVARAPVDINRMLEDVIRLVSIEATARKVALKFLPEDRLPRVSGERIHLQQAVVNLVLNGFEAMEALPAAERQLTVRTGYGGDERVSIAVSDNGPGIPADGLSALFEPFFTTKRDGLGMGLSIVRTIVEAHGGSVHAKNNADRGAAFFIELPPAEQKAD